MNYAHRHLEDGTDIYFISNTDSIRHDFVCNFRVSGKLPELWNPMNGSVNEANVYEIKNNGTTMVKISLEGLESVFVVFRKSAIEKKRSLQFVCDELSSENLNSNWNVDFLKEYGYDETVHFDSLTDWSLSENDEIRYYSGTAIYKKCINIGNETLLSANRAVLDLGNVHICAEVMVNGQYVDVLWMPPYRIDIYDYLKTGMNEIEISVTNQWTNRLIGDERYPKQDDGYKLEGLYPKGKMPEWYLKNNPMPVGPRMTFCTGQFYKKDDPLIPSGLVGPVYLRYYRNYKK